ncbi:uncharacterized protein LOC133903733 isoform X2 [Phragmites australis]|uniref:uncharacterized protein LOC133903733 isoform X2 n=1 Tax=Phragmites australis TaxID=29695 RepID=UPI002D77579F|nr:uncharacterized protein LOC133903733 isoform X2 [Phragmites australis]
MPRLQRLELYFLVQKREGGGFDIGLENLTSLKHLTVRVDCRCARIREVEDVETKIRDVIEIHPNHPTLELSIEQTHCMVHDENKGDREAPEQRSDDESDMLAADDESDNGSEASKRSEA